MSRNHHIEEIIGAYDSTLVRAYCSCRFKILHQTFLEEIGQYLPDHGTVIDVGCGFGLFSLYYGRTHPDLNIIGIDLNPRRVEMANRASRQLSMPNVSYLVGDVTTHEFPAGIDGTYMLDIVHHVPASAVPLMLRQIHDHLNPGARLIVKDINTRPAYKRWFTYTLDKMMDSSAQVNYWNESSMLELMRGVGFSVYHHLMVDFLPYPHIIYICQKPESAGGH